MRNLIFIHGGESFNDNEGYQNFLRNTYVGWQSELWTPEETTTWVKEIAKRWYGKGGVVYMPVFPNKLNAKYEDWKIVFEGILTKLNGEDEVSFVGGSLGGCFLLKYFSERETSSFVIPTKEESAPGNGADSSQAQNDKTKKILHISQVHLLAACISEGDFSAPTNYDALQELGSKVVIWHAEDDTVVPIETGKILSNSLPQAQTHFFPSKKGYGHFYSLERIPELEEVLLW